MQGGEHAERPWVTVHYAQTLDGRIASRTGESQWISGAESLRLAHELRAEHDGVMVGIGTVLADDPQLTVRHVPGESPARIVVDSTLRLPLDARVLTGGNGRAIVGTTAHATPSAVACLRNRGTVVLQEECDEHGRVHLPALLRSLRSLGIRSVLVEGGQGLLTSMLRDRLVDRWIVCIAPKLLGRGVDAIADLGITSLAEAIAFTQGSFTSCGSDVIFDGRLR